MRRDVLGALTGDLAVILAGAALVSAQSVDVINRQEPMIAGAASSLLLAALIGSLIGVYLHQGKPGSAPIIPQDGSAGWRLLLGVLWRAGSWGVGVSAYAFLAAWAVTGYCLWKYGKVPPPAPPLTGILGAFIIPLLPRYQALVEGVADKVGDLAKRVIGGAP